MMKQTQGDFSPSTCRLRVKPRCDASRVLKAGKDLMTPPTPLHPPAGHQECLQRTSRAAGKPADQVAPCVSCHRSAVPRF